AEATLEPPPFPGPRSGTDNTTAPTLAEAAIPPAPLPGPTAIAAGSSAVHGSDSSSSLDRVGEGAASAATQSPVAQVVAESTFAPPPVRDLATPDASRADTGSRSENGSPSVEATTDAPTHNDVSGNSDTNSLIDSTGTQAADTAATPATDTPAGHEPAADIAEPAGTGAPGGDSPPRAEIPTTVDGTPGETNSASPEPTHAGVDSHGADPHGTLDIGADGTAAASDRDVLNDDPVVELTTGQVLTETALGDEHARPLDPTATTADSSLTPAASSTLDTTAGDSATTGTAVDQNTGEHDNQDSGDTDGVERYRAEDLGAFVAHGTATNHALYEGPDGRWHAVGDAVGQGLHREGTGRLRDARGYVTDDNKLPPKGIDAHAERGQSLDQMPAPTSPDQLADLEAVRAATLARAEKQDTKNEIWDNQVKPLIDSLEQAGLTIDRNTFGSANFKDELREAVPNLPRNLRNAAVTAAADYAQASQALVDASETLGVAGGRFIGSLLHPDGQTITSSDGTRGVKGTFDRTIYDGSATPMLIIIEEKGAGSTLGVSKVDDPNNSGPKIIAQQCSPEYVHHLLQNDDSLAAALQADPQLYYNVQSTIEGSNGGAVKCLLVHTSADGTVNVVPHLLDPGRFRRDTIRIPSDEGTQ
uniref:hypothetical protein n=1 Tax=Catenulispora pinisilvae TaxID=2705253 RepID=UPI001E4F72CF